MGVGVGMLVSVPILIGVCIVLCKQVRLAKAASEAASAAAKRAVRSTRKPRFGRLQDESEENEDVPSTPTAADVYTDGDGTEMAVTVGVVVDEDPREMD